MDTYFISVKTALLLFPIIAFIITTPYIFLQYHKYGSIPFFRTTIVYSFVLYLMIIYFLVILPLPSIEEVKNLSTPITQLIPFHFIADFFNETSFVLTDFHTYLPALKNPAFYTVIFNIFLFVPLGIYLRYYFKCNWIKTLVISFGLSLFFELTQLSGLYGIYPRPYRLFDVDDLMINTLGGMIGFWITPICYLFLPSRDKLDELSYERGKRVSYFRRLVAFFIDCFVMLILNMIISYLIPTSYRINYIITIVLYEILLPWLTKGRTIGKFIVQIKVTTESGTTPKFYQYCIRYGMLYFLILPAPFYLMWLFGMCSTLVWYLQLVCLVLIIYLGILYLKFFFGFFLNGIRKKGILPYEKYSKTILSSSIKLPLMENEKQEIEEEKQDLKKTA